MQNNIKLMSNRDARILGLIQQHSYLFKEIWKCKASLKEEKV